MRCASDLRRSARIADWTARAVSSPHSAFLRFIPALRRFVAPRCISRRRRASLAPLRRSQRAGGRNSGRGGCRGPCRASGGNESLLELHCRLTPKPSRRRLAGWEGSRSLHSEEFEHWSKSGRVERIDDAPEVRILKQERGRGQSRDEPAPCLRIGRGTGAAG